MEKPILSDRTQFPTDEVIYSYIGKSKTLWLALFDDIAAAHPDISKEWRYYNDGKSWLMKVTRKSKTIFWLSLFEKSFRTTFYFTDKAEKTIAECSISKELKQQYKKGKKYGKIRGITIMFGNKKDIEYAKTLIDIKLAIK